jgi:arginase family enzyme
MTQLMGRPGSLVDSNADPVLTHDKLCNADNTVFFGTNLSHPGNKNEHLAYLHDEHFKVFSSQAVALDPQARARDALEHLERKHKAIWVHLDVDSIDPGECPLANVPNFTGVTFTNMMLALDVLLASENVIGLTVAEVNPDHDPGLVMTKRLTETILAMLARKRFS